MSEVGAGTPLVVADRLLAFEPASIGMKPNPSDAQVHVVRELLEQIWRDYQVQKAIAVPDRVTKAEAASLGVQQRLALHRRPKRHLPV